ncbi:hypothetical protein AF72_01905 [Xylella taiwanensis]|uniref:Uncharacterized protein n=1 Tax=Xylella taiwanensis TaxID=1444770 RepID=Z9JLH7_9GAMM|nr:hypothetical protein AF72_01905 [Xylella taiwanensis]
MQSLSQNWLAELAQRLADTSIRLSQPERWYDDQQTKLSLMVLSIKTIQ